jgi:hypothetical protein
MFVNDIVFVEKSKHDSTSVLSAITPWSRILCKNLTVPQLVKILPHLINPQSHCLIHNSPQLVNIVGQHHSVHAFPSYSFKMQFDIIFPPVPRYWSCFFSSEFPTINPIFYASQDVYAPPMCWCCFQMFELWYIFKGLWFCLAFCTCNMKNYVIFFLLGDSQCLYFVCRCFGAPSPS